MLPLLSARELHTFFAAKPILSGINFDLYPGEIVGVVGLRSAGKSVLLQTLAGIYPPTSGEVWLAGAPMTWTAQAAQRRGIEFVPQTPLLVDVMPVLANIFLGRERGRQRLDLAAMATVAYQWLDRFALPRSLAHQRAGELTDEERQLVALIRAFARPARLLILDEALSMLSFARQQLVLQHLRELAGGGTGIILSSDDLNLIFTITDRVLVLYQGRQAALRATASTTPREIVELMVGSVRQERVTPLIWAFENYYQAQQQAEALRQQQLQLQDNLAEQDTLNRELVRRLQDQMAALDQLNQALQEANHRLIVEREAERKALARELHDQVIQDLLSFNYQIEHIEEEIEQASVLNELQNIRRGIRDVVAMLRQMCSDLRPPTLDSHGLAAALRSLVGQWSEQTGIAVELNLAEPLERWSETIELTVFRIAQEGLSNVRKHAGATRVQLEVRRTSAGGVMLRLADNGRGMEMPPDLTGLAERKHFGLISISERVSLLRGTLHFGRSAWGGLEVRVEIPNPAPFPVEGIGVG
ncbi:ATP-binding cassette domain-containing protein [Chloroflexus sp.]|uniref:ATP-binding cassette domain-containing protein n=1 Tax=Chloroflexus sp. TaxID=1904827 RepID=UPI00261310BD|nr:ATP-binding cassette domain-containing protein [uncultured Chloroflexus sp.]